MTREADPTEVTPLTHQRRTYGPDGRVMIDAVDDPGECRQLHVAVVPHQSTHWIPDNTGTAGRRDCTVDRANDPQRSRPRVAHLRNHGSPLGGVASDLD